jgi:hypothetical protein
MQDMRSAADPLHQCLKNATFNRSMKTQLTLFLSFLVVHCFGHNGEPMDSLIDAKAKAYQLKSLVIIHETGGMSYTHEIRRFDSEGNVIDRIMPSDGNQITRYAYRYDSLGRRTNFLWYNKEDTSKVISELKYFYVDSSFHYTERYDADGQLETTVTHRDSVSKNIFWVEEIEKSHASGRETKTVSRYSFFGDTLLVSEFIHFDRDGNMSDIDAYFHHTSVDSLGNRTETGGTYVIEPGSIDDAAYIQFYRNPNELYQRQLDGEFKYTMGDVNEYKIYNAKGQLVQDGFNYMGKQTFEYNSNNQLVTITDWNATDSEGTYTIVEHFTYDERGLPVSIERKNQQGGTVEVYRFVYDTY